MPGRTNLSGGTDPLSPFKDDAEERWAAWLAGTFEEQYGSLLEELDPQQPKDPGNDWWQGWIALMAGFAVADLQRMSEEGAFSTIEHTGVGVDWDVVLGQSENWASTYGFGLVRDINATSQQALQAGLQRYYNGEIDYATLVQQMSSRYGPVRGAMIASTEVTRGFERGVDIYEDELRRQGMQTDRVWWTEAGACPICEPNHGILRSQGWTISGAPAHPRCRCWTDLVLVGAQRSAILVPNWPRKSAIRVIVRVPQGELVGE
jgi:hypothetical protein